MGPHLWAREGAVSRASHSRHTCRAGVDGPYHPCCLGSPGRREGGSTTLAVGKMNQQG